MHLKDEMAHFFLQKEKAKALINLLNVKYSKKYINIYTVKYRLHIIIMIYYNHNMKISKAIKIIIKNNVFKKIIKKNI